MKNKPATRRRKRRDMSGDAHVTIRCYKNLYLRIKAAAMAFRLSQADVVRLAFDQKGTAKTLAAEVKRRNGATDGP